MGKLNSQAKFPELTFYCMPGLSVDYRGPRGGATTINTHKEFWRIGEEAQYLFVFAPDGRCSTYNGDSSSTQSSHGKLQFPLTVSSIALNGRFCNLVDLRVWGTVVTWDEAFGARGKKRGREAGDATGGMRTMWEKRQFTDATVSCGQRSFPVHRAVLAAKSRVFEAMFGEQFREGQQHSATIGDVEPEVLEAFLSYLYIGSLPSDCDFAAVLKLADQYEVDDLLSYSSEALVEKLPDDEATMRALLALFPLRKRALVTPAWEKAIMNATGKQSVIEMMLARICPAGA